MTLPLYAYRCTQCGHRFEKIQNFSADPEHECPKCHGLLERPLTAPRLNFKGAGWYVNDYASKSSAPASEGGPETKTESKEAGTGSAQTESKGSSSSGESSTSASTSSPASSTAPSSTTSGSSAPASSS
jgi:putative FmdB family regulatory protein